VRKQLANSAILADMLKLTRYVLATVCFAASVGCLALWWRSEKLPMVESVSGTFNKNKSLAVTTYCGRCDVALLDFATTPWRFRMNGPYDSEFRARNTGYPRFKLEANFSRPTRGLYVCHFPLWYPALIFALAGFASLRLGRRFTLRSALIATTVVAGLLGMAVIL